MEIQEARRVIYPLSGGLEVYFGATRCLGLSEWKRIVEAHGDFAVVGLAMIKNAPLTNFDRLCLDWGHANRMSMGPESQVGVGHRTK